MRAGVVMLATAALICAKATAQSPPRFRSAAEAVQVDALVLDGRTPVAGLGAADFELRDSGVPQQIEDIQSVEVPFSMMLALDTSSSMTPGLPRLQEAALGAVDALRPNDRAAVLTFSDAIGTPTAWSPSREPVLAAIANLYADGTTSLVDAAFTAMVRRDPEPGRRNLVILFTDGTDTSSWLPDDAALDLAERSDVVVYCVGIDREPTKLEHPLGFRSGIRLSWKQPVMRSGDFLPELAQRTGGEYLSTSIGALQKTFRRIVDVFRTRYVLTYTPRGVANDGWHPIDVRLKGKRYKITARHGYQR